MKITLKLRRKNYAKAYAFTLTELLVAMALMSVVLGGTIYAHITGLRFYEITRAKLGASESTRITLGLMNGEIRGSQRVAVGTGSSSSFVEVSDGTNQQGNAIQIFRPDWNSSTNSNAWIRYYRDDSSSSVYRLPGPNTSPQLVAEYVTNAVVFRAVDYTGVNVLTDNDNNKVIDVRLQFYQLRYPNVAIGTNKFFEYFQITSRITRRSI